VREWMYFHDQLGKGKLKSLGQFYGKCWQEILIVGYVVLFTMPLQIILFWGFTKLSLSETIQLLLFGFTIVLFVHFQVPLITKPHIFAIIYLGAKTNENYFPDTNKKDLEIDLNTEGLYFSLL